MGELSAEAVLSRYRAAQSRRRPWESLWQDCYTFALPQRGSGFGAQFDPARRHAERLFDGTATDAVEQLAASLLSELTPPWSQWFNGSDGALVLRHLRQSVLDRRLGPRASDVELRFLEGQRSIAAHILSMIDRGRG